MKLKKISFILFTISFSWHLSAQCRLTGTITDKEDNSKVIGAIIYFPDLKIGAATDNNGVYIIENLPKGKYLAEIKQLGYTSISLLINACEKPTQDFILSPSVVETKEVVVTGASKATELLKMPGAVTTIDHTVLFKTTSTNIIDAITTKPGISQITTGSGISKPVIRGLGYNRIITLNDGIRQEGQQWGDEHGIEIDEFGANKIEILKGPASLMYGSDAMAGVINILSTPSVAQGTVSGNIATNFQSNNGLFGISAMQNGNLKNINWMLRGSFKSAGNYSNKYDGKVFNSGYNEHDLSGTIGINKKWGFSHLIFSSFNQNLGLIEGERDSITGKFVKQIKRNDSTAGISKATDEDLNSRKLNNPRQEIAHSKIALDNTLILGKARLTVLLAYQHNSRKEFGDVLNPDIVGLNFSLSSYTYDVKYFFQEKKNLQLTIGSNGIIQQNKNLGKEVLIPEYIQTDIGAFGYFKKEINSKFNIAGGVRYDMRIYKSMELKEDSLLRFRNTNNAYQNMSGSIGLTYELNKQLVLKANIARGYRAPQAAEVSSNGLHEGTFRYEVGNSELKAETSYQGDLGLLYNSEHITIDAALFSNNITNFIYLKKLNSIFGGDSITDPANPTPTYKFVQGNASLNGGEISIDMHPHPFHWLHFENTFSYVNAINKNQNDSGKYLPFTPATRITTELRADLKKLSPTFVNFYILTNAQFYLKQNKVLLLNASETPTPGYTLINAAIGSDIKNKKGVIICSAIFSANNITNIAYQSHLSRLKYAPENYATGRMGVYNMGRNFSVKAMFPLSFKK